MYCMLPPPLPQAALSKPSKAAALQSVLLAKTKPTSARHRRLCLARSPAGEVARALGQQVLRLGLGARIAGFLGLGQHGGSPQVTKWGQSSPEVAIALMQ
jgi:hypothetical protein